MREEEWWEGKGLDAEKDSRMISMGGRCGKKGGMEVIGRRWTEVQLAVVVEEEEGGEERQQGGGQEEVMKEKKFGGEVLANKIQSFGSISMFGFIS